MSAARQPIATAPKDGRSIKAIWTTKWGDRGFGTIKWSNEESGWVGFDGGRVTVSPTHWLDADRMSPMERAARALAKLHNRQSIGSGMDDDQYADTAWQDYTDQARAVLTAIREPSEGMASAGAADVGNGWTGPHSEYTSLHGCTSVYQAMIDAALSEGG